MLGAAAGALSAVLGLSVRTSTAPAPFPGTQIVFRPPAALIDDASFARRKLAGMVTLAERFALRRR